MDDLRKLIDAVAQARADIAPTYQEYVQLAFALATECGEAGRSYFHDLCRFSPKYDAKNADKVYSSALSSNRGDVRIATAFHLAKQAGVTISYEGRATEEEKPAQGAKVQGAATPYTHAHARESDETPTESYEEEALLPGSDPLCLLPQLPPASWPEPLATLLKYATTPAQRDVLLLGAFTVLGSSLERYVRCHYSGKYLYPCLQTFVVAPPASGKGVLALLRLLVEPLHDELRGNYEKQMEAYRKEKAAYDTLGKERSEKEPPERPNNKMFIISGNNSGTGILQNLMDAEGTGLIIEPEADTISTAIGADYGHWSDTMRKCFDHAPLSYNRRTGQEYREVRKTFLSVLLSGTPAQVKPLIPSAENGLFSRQVFYYMPGIRRWQNQFDRDDTDLEAVFAAMGKEWKRFVDTLKGRGLHTLRLTDAQKEEFNRHFAALFRRAGLTNGDEMNSSVARLAMNICRILSVVAVLRGNIVPDKDIPRDNLKDGIITRWDMTMDDADFRAVMGLVEPLYRHATHILSLLPATEVNRRPTSERDGFFADLPDTFTRDDLKELTVLRGLKENTVFSWLKRLQKKGMVKFEEGSYRKMI